MQSNSPEAGRNELRQSLVQSATAVVRRLVILILAVACYLSSPPTELFAADPSNSEQLMLEYINRFRMNPQAELDLLVNIDYSGGTPSWESPRSDNNDIDNALSFYDVDASALVNQWSSLSVAPPVAWNSNLNDSATAFSQVMLAENEQSHDLPPYNLDLIARIQSGGYAFTGGGSAGENLFAFTKSIIHAHSAFVIDWGDDGPSGGNDGIQDPPSHRDLMMDGIIREVGIGMIAGNGVGGSQPVGPFLITQHFATANATGPFLTGVAYDDTDHNNFYTGGEGLQALTITATRNSDSAVWNTTTWASGGYTLEVADGTYTIVASGGSLAEPITFNNVVVGTENVKVDFIVSDAVPGDITGDFMVTKADLAQLLENFGKSSGAILSEGDLDEDGKVGLSDLLIVKKNFGNGVSAPNPTATVVPEPTTFALLLMLMFCGLSTKLPSFFQKKFH